MQDFIGRAKEIEKLEQAKTSNRSEFIAVYGRRRVGKTFLIRKVFQDDLVFQATGVANVNKNRQLLNFWGQLREYNDNPNEFIEVPNDWFTAFQHLKSYLKKQKIKRKVIFLDELPWFDTQKSDFLQSLEHFWNGWAALRDDIVLVVCGSAASWMVNKLINHTGGLHNRLTERILLQPFNLKETEALLRLKNPTIDRYQILQLYMVMGGIPFYLDAVKGGQSAAQNVEQICFAPDGLLRYEFENLFAALFKNADRHISVVKALATKAKGLTRNEISDLSGLSTTNKLPRVLNELEKSGFLRRYNPFQKKNRNSLYQLTDFYTLFYLRFIKNNDPADLGNWINGIDHPAVRAWSGYAFELVCLQHIQQIKKALGVAGVITHTSTWRSQKSEKGAQIDLVIDRRDQVVNLCEMKFSLTEYTITKSYAEQLKQKLASFREETKTKKALHLTFVTANGLKKNGYAVNLVARNLGVEELFEG